MSPDQLLDVMRAALSTVDAEAIEVAASHTDGALTRFAESRIHQSTARIDGEARVRVLLDGGRFGVASTNDLTPDGVRDATRRAHEVAALVPGDEVHAPLPVGEGASYSRAGADDDATAAGDPADRADVVRRLLAPLPADAVGAGTVETSRTTFAVLSTTGTQAVHRSTRASVTLLGSAPDSTGYAQAVTSRLSDVDPDQLGRRVADKVERGHKPRTVDPGTWPVVLEPLATAELVQWLGWIAFGAKAIREGRSPLAGRYGACVTSGGLTIHDDALAAGLPGVPFDFEGVPKQRVPLLVAGVARSVLHDSTSAHLDGAVSTGHAAPAPNPEGPWGSHLVMEPGSASIKDLVHDLERGLLVTRFHYTNVVHPTTATITGMTRDGTFLIEDGEVVGAVTNLRMTDSILSAFGTLEDIGSATTVLSETWADAVRAPAVRLAGLRFSSAY